MTITIEKLAGKEDLELLTPEKDVIIVNSSQALFMALNESHLTIIRRLDQETLVEMKLKRDKIEYKADGTILCVGANAYDVTKHSLYGVEYGSMKNTEWRLARQKFEDYNNKLREVQL